jgi:hypothetical protein
MIRGLVEGTSWGKISGHRKGDLSEKFDMRVCINCHYEDSAHGAKRVYKDFCTRCHDVKSKGNLVMGPTHLNSSRWVYLNLIGNGLFVLFLLLGGSFIIYQSHKGISSKIKLYFARMRKAEDPAEQDIPKVEESNDPQDQKSTETEIKPNDNGK